MKKDFEATINITLMDREAVDYFTLSEILETYPDVSGVIINELEYDYSACVFYAHTGLGRVIFPRHLNETLEDIEVLMQDEENAGCYAFHPYSYTFGDRHGYSAKFYIIEDTKEKVCKYKDSCYEKDCTLCPHYKYYKPTYEETHSKNTDTDPCYGETVCTGTNNPYQE